MLGRRGRPAYWPIVQIIRACAQRPDFAQLTEALGAGIAQVAALIPEIIRTPSAHGERAGSKRIDLEQARFRLFDAVATLLKSVAQREPLVIVIDDLHDADLAAIQMVCFLARALKDSPILLIGIHPRSGSRALAGVEGVIVDTSRAFQISPGARAVSYVGDCSTTWPTPTSSQAN